MVGSVTAGLGKRTTRLSPATPISRETRRRPRGCPTATWPTSGDRSSPGIRPLQVVAQTTDGRLKTPPFKPMDKRFLIVPHGTGVELAAEVRPGAEIRKAAFYDGDVRLGEAAVAPFQLFWSQVPAGPRAVFAKYTTADGKVGVSNPVLILRAGE